MSGPLSSSAPLVTLVNVRVTQGGLTVLDGLNFELRPGEACLLTGPNGGGKSSFLALLRGDLSPASGERGYWLEGARRTSAVRAKRLLPLVSPAQEAWFLTRDWVQTVRDVLLAGLEGEMLNLSRPDRAALERLKEVVTLTGLDGLLGRDFRTLSHGQRRRALLARALMPRPAALLLDEFTDGLSPSARLELRGVLEGVSASGVALVLATHHPGEAPELNLRRLELEGGRLRSHGGEKGDWRERGGGTAMAVPFPSREAQDAPPLVTLEGASVYRNGQLALGPLDWVWREGQHWLLTGENGAGKSTLARLLAGEFHPALEGRVIRHFLENRSAGRDLLSERRRHIGVVSAELGIRGRRPWSGFELVASGFGGSEGFAPELTPAQSARLHGLAERLDLEPLLSRPADTLSQGQLARLLLARAVVHRPRLLILDEGLNFLDSASRARVLELLPGLMAQGTHLLVVAHRMADAPPGLTDHLHLEGGLIRK